MANSSKLLTRTRNVALALAITSALVACGGGGGGRRNNNQPAAVVGDTFAVTTTGRLLNFNRTSGGIQTSTQITGLGTDTVIGFDVRPIDNTLIVVASAGTTGRIYRVDPASGAATLLSTISVPLSGTTFGADFNPVPDRLRLVSNTGQNLRINVANGAATVDGTLTLNGSAANGVTEVGYNNNFGQACRTQLFYLDTTGNRLLTTTAPNDGILTVVGSFTNVTTNAAASGFEVFTDAMGNSTASVVLTVGGIVSVYSLNLGTGAVTGAAQIQLNPGENILGIGATTQATVTQGAGELTGLTAANQIFTFNSAAPNKVCTGPTAIGGLGTGENVVGIDTRAADSNLYGVGVTPGAMGAPGTGRVFQINRMTGAISGAVNIVPQGSTTQIPIMGTNFGVDFNPVPDALRITSDAGQNLRFVFATGVTASDGPTGGTTTSAAYTNSFGPTSPSTTTLYTIDTATGTLNIQNPPNVGTQVPVGAGAGNLGLTGPITGSSGFDINGVNNLAVAGLQVGTATTTTLYGINLSTGAATAFAGGNIGAGVGVGTPPITGAIRGMTFTNNPQVTAIGLTATGNQLVNFSTTANLGVAANLATISTTNITGLMGGENVVGLDFRTSSSAALNNRLYVVTDQARTYVVDPATGAATNPIMLVANAGDAFAGFMGSTAFGIDFNPAADRLRTVAGTRNLRSVLDGVPMMTAGTTFTDTALTRVAPTLAAPAIGGAAYSNSTPGMPLPTVTNLFTIDTANDMLFVQNPPNNGTQVFVGRLGVDVASVGGFDITGPNTAYAILTTNAITSGPGAVTNGLYSINLANGAATLVGAVNPVTATQITGLALPVSATDPTGGITTATGVQGNSLITFQTSATGVGTVGTVSITGLATGETITDIDFQPATAVAPPVGMAATPGTSGTLVGFSSLGNVYTISATTGAATPLGLAPDTILGASGVAFAGVGNGTVFGIDFNPVPNLLRVISNSTPTQQNLRINTNVTPALARLDLAIENTTALPAVNAVAAAYTNAFPLPAPVVPVVPPAVAPAPTTVLFDLDLATNTLQRQDPAPNMGMLTQVGRLDPIFNFQPNASFDMVGGENGLVLAILQRVGATQSSLYRINLATGQATLVGDIGPAMGPTLIGGLALRLR
jgi:trimeric autotransporter adhesin